MWRLTARSQGLQLLLLRPATCCARQPCALTGKHALQASYSNSICSRSNKQARRSLRGASVLAMARPWRPDVNDVDRLSRGDGARQRGTGNFNIPHRLNQDERPVYEAAKKKGFLAVKGTGYRKQRKGHPLPNIYRQWCDAREQATIVIEQDASGDCVVVDLATLRLIDNSQVIQTVREAAQELGLREVHYDERPADAVPFDIIPYKEPSKVSAASAASSAEGAHSATTPTAPPSQADIAAAQAAVDEQGSMVRILKAQGETNQSPAVQQAVQELLQRKAHLEQMLQRQAQAHEVAGSSHDSTTTDGSGSNSSSTTSEDGTDSSSSSSDSGDNEVVDAQEDMGSTGASAHNSDSEGSSNGRLRREPLDDDHPLARLAIWQIPAQPLFFAAQRPAAKELAKRVAAMQVL